MITDTLQFLEVHFLKWTFICVELYIEKVIPSLVLSLSFSFLLGASHSLANRPPAPPSHSLTLKGDQTYGRAQTRKCTELDIRAWLSVPCSSRSMLNSLMTDK